MLRQFTQKNTNNYGVHRGHLESSLASFGKARLFFNNNYF